MAGFVVFIVTTFQIWTCHVTYVYKLAKNITSQDSLGKVAKYELDTCAGSRVIKNFLWGAFTPPSPGWNRVNKTRISVWEKSKIIYYP